MPRLRRGLYLVRVEKNGYSPFARQLSVLSLDQELDVSLLPLAEDAPRGISGRALAALWPPAQIPPPSTSSLNFNSSAQQQTANAIGHANVTIPSFLGDPYFSDDSFSVNGQNATTIPYLLGNALVEGDFENRPEMQTRPNMLHSSAICSAAAPLVEASPRFSQAALMSPTEWSSGMAVTLSSTPGRLS